MAHIRRLQLMFILALVVCGLAVGAAPHVSLAGDLAVYKKGSFDITESEGQIAGSKGGMADAGRESSYQISFIDDEEIIEQLASSPGCRGPSASRACRESS